MAVMPITARSIASDKGAVVYRPILPVWEDQKASELDVLAQKCKQNEVSTNPQEVPKTKEPRNRILAHLHIISLR